MDQGARGFLCSRAIRVDRVSFAQRRREFPITPEWARYCVSSHLSGLSIRRCSWAEPLERLVAPDAYALIFDLQHARAVSNLPQSHILDDVIAALFEHHVGPLSGWPDVFS